MSASFFTVDLLLTTTIWRSPFLKILRFDLDLQALRPPAQYSPSMASRALTTPALDSAAC
jgi:hypothetical protein